MKRPLVLTALWLLAGVLCGITIVPAPARAAVLILAIVSIPWMITESRDLGKGTLLFLCTFAVMIFAVGFFRGRHSSRIYESAELSGFYEKYEATNPGEFDYALYLKGMGVKSEEEREKTGEPPVAVLGRARAYFGAVLDENLSAHDAGIYRAMLLGDKAQMDDGVKDLYQTSGISHLLAVSGLHISLIGMGLYGLLKKRLRLSENVSMAVAAVSTFLYVCLTGASASAVRAGIMLIINLLSRKMRRSYDLLTALSTAFILLLLKEPYVVFLSGTRLSFGAMAGIFFGNEVTLSLYVPGILKKRSALLSALISDLCVTLFSLPVTVSNYYFFPPYSVILNLMVIPLMTAVMVSGLLVLLFGLFGLRVLLVPAAMPGHAVLSLYEWFCRKAEALPYSRIVTGKPETAGILMYYAVFLICFLILTGELSVRKDPKEESRKLCRKRDLKRILLSLLVPVSILFLRSRGTEESYVEMLDVGQGDCFHIHEGEMDILVDGGSSGYDKVGENVIEPYLMSRGIRDLDLVIVSHADTDHTNGIRYLLTEGKVETGTLLLPRMAEADEKYDDLKAGSYRSLQYLKAGDVIRAGKATLTCLYAGEGPAALSDTNRQSDVILLEQGTFSMLFTGDMTKADERLLLSSGYGKRIRDIDVLKVAHHGSKTASGETFLDRAGPAVALLSYRQGNRYGHPHKETTEALLEAGAQLLKTPETGAVKIIIKEDAYEIELFRETGKK